MHMPKRRATLAALLASAAFTSPAFAQDVVATPDDEIVVTAQKREENVQKVPISIQAIGTTRLDNLNVTNFEDYSQLLPSLAFQTTQPGVTNVYMRGVASGGDGNHSGSLPSVGVYLDEQPVTTIGGTLDVHVYDVARIESLAGPQGTLYGASSQAGTIRIITNKPDSSSFYGRVDSELNTVRKGGIGGRLEGMVNAPLAPYAALRVVGFYQHDAGYIDNVASFRRFSTGHVVNNNAFVKEDYNTVDTWGGRAALKIDLDDNWTATPTVLYQESRTKGSFGSDPRVGDLKTEHFFDEYRNDRFIQAALTIEGRIGNWDVTYAGAMLDRKDNSSSDYTDYSEAYDQLYANYTDSSGNFVCSGIAGCFYFTNAAGNPIDPRQRVVGSDHFKKVSQEVRIASPQDASIRVVAGAFYQRQSNVIHQDYKVDGLDPLLSVNGLPGTLWLTQQYRVDRDYAAFGELSIDLGSKVTLTAGGRYYKYDNSLIGFFGFGRNPGNGYSDGPPNAAASNRTGVAQCFTTSGQRLYDRDTNTYATSRTLLPAAVAGGPCTNLARYVNGKLVPVSTSDTGFLHRLNLQWKPNEDMMFYGTWSRGYRPGGINRRGTIPPYQADFLTNYEIGWKTTLANGRLRFNGAIYQQDWAKFQFSFLGQNSFTEIHNGPNARIRGIEMDLNYRSGGLSLTASGSYTDAKTTQNLCAIDDPTFTCASSSISAPRGTRLPVTPRFKGNITGRYTFPTGATEGHVQFVLAHQSSATADIRTNIFQAPTHSFINPSALLGILPAYTTLDLSAGGEIGRFSYEFFVANVWDERGQISRFQECGSCGQRPYAVYINPQTFGVRLGTKF
ncbi:TonB-dependent receptor [Sphingomonas sp. LB-2]|uniref:TonB-dependent receptor n=1 Tax=Sphingomonas caeni TaxID=2984949 RepID=UPI00223290F9|nr:TonB-dependent receptor [Sphingomonas caeni]MCW3849040.1 TonB-dependent receptor [Sphingomonas caeni]